MKKLLYKLVIFISIIATFSSNNIALAAFDEIFFAENNIIYYDPDGELDNDYCAPSAVNGTQVAVIGDSITNGARSALEGKMSGINIDGVDGRTWAEGLAIIPSFSSQKVIVFALGTNNQNSITDASISDVISAVGADRKIVFVTNFGRDDGSNPTATMYATNNEAINKASLLYDNVSVADWATAVSSDPAKYIIDPVTSSDKLGVHPTEEGKALFAEIINTAIGNTNAFTASGELSVDGNAEIIAGFLSQKGYSQTSIAAIIGNFRAESGLNPKRLEVGVGNDMDEVPDSFRLIQVVNGAAQKTYRGGVGLAQWTSDGRVQGLQNYADDAGLSAVSMEAQLGWFFEECTKTYRCSPSELNAKSLEDATFHIFKVYEGPAASCGKDVASYCAQSNLIDPKSVDDLKSGQAPAAMSAYTTRFEFAQGALGIVPSTTCYVARGNGNISQTALELAWDGIRSHEKGDPKPAYVEAMKAVNTYVKPCGKEGVCPPEGASCDQFVATVMRYSGADPNFPLLLGGGSVGSAGTEGGQYYYLHNTPEKYQQITVSDTSDLVAGDILVVHGHIKIYVTLPDGTGGIAHASWNDRTGEYSTGVSMRDITDTSRGEDGMYEVFRMI